MSKNHEIQQEIAAVQQEIAAKISYLHSQDEQDHEIQQKKSGRDVQFGVTA